MPLSSLQLDTTIEIITPENIAFQYRLAGPFRRMLAYLVDLAIQGAMMFAGTIVIAYLFGAAGIQSLTQGVVLVLWFLLAWFYGGLFETFWNGQTPGKRAMRIRVLSLDGQPVNGLQAVLRNVLRVVDAQPLIFCQVGLFAAAMNDRFQRLGDLACGTMVVVEERQWLRGLMRTQDARAIQLAAQIPARFEVSRSLAQALAAYVLRRPNFPRARRLEIAQHLGQPLREMLGLPGDTDLDLLLCGLYHRAFIAEPGDRSEALPAGTSSVVAARSWARA